jgi:hypothetical protein
MSDVPMSKLVDDIENEEREKRRLQEQKEKYLRQHPRVIRMANFWAKLVPSVKELHGELEGRFSGDPKLTCRFVKLSEKSFQLSSNVRPNERFVTVELDYFWIILRLGYMGCCELRDGDLDKVTPESAAADLLNWALGRSDLRSLPWYRISGGGVSPAVSACPNSAVVSRRAPSRWPRLWCVPISRQRTRTRQPSFQASPRVDRHKRDKNKPCTWNQPTGHGGAEFPPVWPPSSKGGLL